MNTQDKQTIQTTINNIGALIVVANS
jgi:hypothetical protein